MAIKTRKLPVRDLDLGMFISKLDVPWASTPFPLQGFYVESQEDIDKLSHFCNHVYIDDVKTNLNPGYSRTQSEPALFSPKISKVYPTKIPPGSLKSQKPQDKNRGYVGSAGARLRKGDTVYEVSKSMSQEVKNAKKIYHQLNHSIEEVARSIESDKNLDTKTIKKTANKIVDSIIRNPDALAWLSRMQSKDAYTYQHTIRMTIWGISFGRYLGLPREELEVLALATLLTSTGKAKLPQSLFRSHLNEKQKLAYQKHIEYSIDILQKLPDVPASVIYVVEAFCERHNGTGYPLGLKGKRIPFLARVAGLVDYYDILLNPRDPKNAFSSADAISHLFKLRDCLFHGEMVEAFIQAMGVYPTGTLVELSTREIAIIIEQKRDRRLKPKVAVLMDDEKQRLEKFKIIDLQKDLKDKEGNNIRIIGSLPSSAVDFDLEVVHKSLYSKLVGWL